MNLEVLRFLLAEKIFDLYLTLGAKGWVPTTVLDILVDLGGSIDPSQVESPYVPPSLVESIRKRLGIDYDEWYSSLELYTENTERAKLGLPPK